MKGIELYSRDGDRVALVPSKAFYADLPSWPEGFCERMGDSSYRVSLPSRTMHALADGRSPKGILHRLTAEAPKWAVLRSEDRPGRVVPQLHDADDLPVADAVGGSGAKDTAPGALLLEVDTDVLATFRRACVSQGRDMASTIEALMASYSRHAGVA
jgi:hypothetical protein